MQQLRRLDTEFAGFKRELDQVNSEIAEAESRVRQIRRMRSQTEADLEESNRRMGSLLRAWREGDEGSMASELALHFADSEAQRLASARLSRTEITQRESRLDEYMRRLNDLKTKRSAKERDLKRKRQERANFIGKLRRQINSEKAMLKVAEEAAARLEEAARRAEQAAKAAAAGPPAARVSRLAWPVRGVIVTGFGRHKHKEFNAVVNSRGIEIAASPGKRVAAAAAGKVVFSDWLQGYGRVMIIDHGGGLYTVYGHLQDALMPEGGQVRPGMAVGTVGEAGLWGKPSLYFEVRDRGRAVDPMRYLRSGS